MYNSILNKYIRIRYKLRKIWKLLLFVLAYQYMKIRNMHSYIYCLIYLENDVLSFFNRLLHKCFRLGAQFPHVHAQTTTQDALTDFLCVRNKTMNRTNYGKSHCIEESVKSFYFIDLGQISTWHDLSWMILEEDLRKDHGGNAFSMDTTSLHRWWC